MNNPNFLLKQNALVFSVFAQQLQLERNTRQQLVDLGKSGWRNSPVTWQTWGSSSGGEGGNEVEEDEQEEEGKVTSKRAFQEANPPRPTSHELIFDTLRILEAFPKDSAAALYYAKEVSFKKKIFLTTDNAQVCEQLFLSVPSFPDIIEPPSLGDPIKFMFSHRKEGKQFHIVNLHLSTSPKLFAPLDSSIQSVCNRGMIAITVDVDQVFQEVNVVANLENESYQHELASRLVLCVVERQCNRNSMYCVPLLATSTGPNQITVYVRVYGGVMKEVNKAVLRVGHCFQSVNMKAFHVIPLSNEREAKNGRMGMSGVSDKQFSFSIVKEMWTLAAYAVYCLPTHNKEFVRACCRMDPNAPLLADIVEEVPVPLLYSFPFLLELYQAPSTLTLNVLGLGLKNAGFDFSANASQQTFKTTASSQVVGEVIKAWVMKENSHKTSSLPLLPMVAQFMSLPAPIDVNFSESNKRQEIE